MFEVSEFAQKHKAQKGAMTRIGHSKEEHGRVGWGNIKSTGKGQPAAALENGALIRQGRTHAAVGPCVRPTRTHLATAALSAGTGSNGRPQLDIFVPRSPVWDICS
jgi:hypothetical protein